MPKAALALVIFLGAVGRVCVWWWYVRTSGSDRVTPTERAESTGAGNDLAPEEPADDAIAVDSGRRIGVEHPPQPQAIHSFLHRGAIPQTFHESPGLAARVAAGQLPPVSERLPDEPLVVPPVERIGRYGGTWRRAFTGPVDAQNIERILHVHFIYYDLDGVTLMPHIARSWEVKEGGRVFLFHLRKGMKWSDGHPFTADDFLFAYQDMLLNDEFSPIKPSYLRIGGEMVQVSKVGDYTVRYACAQPFPVFLELQATHRALNTMFAPAHYLKQFHPAYTERDELAEKVKQAGLDNWMQLLPLRAKEYLNPEVPVIGAWKTVQPMSSQLFVLERNEYYWAIDPEGNQLPYIDRIVMHLAQDMEVLNLRAIRGEIDMQHRHIQLAKVPLLKAHRPQGNYRVLFWPSLGGTECGVFVNQTYDDDEEIARWLRNLQFRIALSVAIDRDEINESIVVGTGTSRAFVCPPDTRYYPGAQYEQRHAHLDRAASDRILDRIGLNRKDARGFRLRSDGQHKRLVLSVSVAGDAFLDFPGVAQLLAQHWAQVGLLVNVNVEQRTLFTTRAANNQHQISLWGTGGSENIWTYPFFTIPLNRGISFAPQVGGWFGTRGENGVAPTGDIRRLIELYEQGISVNLDERIALGQEIWKIHTRNLYVIGTVGLSPAFNGVLVVKNNFRNVPEVAPNSAALQNPGIARPEQFFFSQF